LHQKLFVTLQYQLTKSITNQIKKNIMANLNQEALLPIVPDQKISKEMITGLSNDLIKANKSKKVELYVKAKAMELVSKTLIEELKEDVFEIIQKKGNQEVNGISISCTPDSSTIIYKPDAEMQKLEADIAELEEKKVKYINDMNLKIAKIKAKIEQRENVLYSEKKFIIEPKKGTMRVVIPK
jgi:histidinol-phosphate/aromatic aminotransferase/cobyric acid decarboxylase-like protein